MFLVRHSYMPDLHLPGGAVDLGESCREAAEREAREEGNIELAAPPELFHVYWNPVGNRRDHVLLFVARGARQSTPRPPSLEIVSAGFHALDALPRRCRTAPAAGSTRCWAARRPPTAGSRRRVSRIAGACLVHASCMKRALQEIAVNHYLP